MTVGVQSVNAGGSGSAPPAAVSAGEEGKHAAMNPLLFLVIGPIAGGIMRGHGFGAVLLPFVVDRAWHRP